MDLINRYDLAGIYPFEKIKPFIEKILKVVIQDKKESKSTPHLNDMV